MTVSVRSPATLHPNRVTIYSRKMPIWVLAAVIYPLAMALACVVAFRASRRGGAIYQGRVPLGASVGTQAEKWLRTQDRH